MVSDGIAYLTADALTPTPFAQTFRVLEQLPSSEKQLKRALSARGIGKLEIKKRGADVDPAVLRTRLKLKGPHSVSYTHLDVYKRQMAIVSMISSIIGWFAFGSLCIVGVILGHISLKQLKTSGEGGRGMAPVSYTHLDVYKRQLASMSQISTISATQTDKKPIQRAGDIAS